jgi:ABC-type glycerol-3-phosphate transport system substrate-binding protein
MELARFNDQVVGYPFALIGLPHLAYHSNIVTSTLPLNWDQLILDTQYKMIFPAAGREGALLALQFYLAAGGSVTNEDGEPVLQVEPLTSALSQLHQGRSNGFILLQSSNVTSLDEAWQAFQTGSADLAQTSATYFLRQRSIESAPGVAPISGLDGPLTPLVEGWAWAVTTSDPQRRAAVIELLTMLVAAANLGDWSYQSNVLPAGREAFTFWPADDPYITFLQQELERARANPLSSTSTIMVVLGNALFDVISLTTSPQAAAEEAVAALQP